MKEQIMSKLQQTLFPKLEDWARGPQKYFVGPETGVLYVLNGCPSYGNPVIEHAVLEIDRCGRERGRALQRTGRKDGFDMDFYTSGCFTMEAVRNLGIEYFTNVEDFLLLARKNLFAAQKIQEAGLTEEEYDFLKIDAERGLQMETTYYN